MSGINGLGVANAYGLQQEYSKKNEKNEKADSKPSTNRTDAKNQVAKEAMDKKLGKTIGKPELSEKAQKYYNDLKKKFGNYDFILVSKDEKENAKANAAKYANPYKTVVLIDEEKIERMATDEKYRQKYESILSGASNQLSQMKDKLAATGANVKGFGMQVGDDGNTSFFAVLDKSSKEQKARIQQKAAQKKAAKKEADKKAAKKAAEKRIQEKRNEKLEKADGENEDEEIITADSMEEFMKKLEDYQFTARSNQVMTEEEQQVGQTIDFKG